MRASGANNQRIRIDAIEETQPTPIRFLLCFDKHRLHNKSCIADTRALNHFKTQRRFRTEQIALYMYTLHVRHYDQNIDTSMKNTEGEYTCRNKLECGKTRTTWNMRKHPFYPFHRQTQICQDDVTISEMATRNVCEF